MSIKTHLKNPVSIVVIIILASAVPFVVYMFTKDRGRAAVTAEEVKSIIDEGYVRNDSLFFKRQAVHLDSVYFRQQVQRGIDSALIGYYKEQNARDEKYNAVYSTPTASLYHFWSNRFDKR